MNHEELQRVRDTHQLRKTWFSQDVRNLLTHIDELEKALELAMRVEQRCLLLEREVQRLKDDMVRQVRLASGMVGPT